MSVANDEITAAKRSKIADAFETTRLHSMDQFRGFIIFSMFIVNTGVLRHWRMFHHDRWHAQFADMIMPGFIFAVGFSFRLSALKRYPKIGGPRMTLSYLRRSLILMLLVMFMEGFSGVGTWQELDQLPRRYTGPALAETAEQPQTEDANDALLPKHFVMHWYYWFLGVLRSQMCEVLGIIALTQLWVLPLILTSSRTRIIAMIIFALTHVVISYWFNWNFANGAPNAMDKFLNFKPDSTFDGGFFGNISWSVVMLAGSLAYDIVKSSATVWCSTRRLLTLGIVLMSAGYLVSIPSRLYDLDATTEEEQIKQAQHLAETPVLPPFAEGAGRPLRQWFPPLPVFQSDEGWKYTPNYWMPSKRIVTLPYTLFASGFCFALYGLFVLTVDGRGWQIGVLRTLGTNALIAYVIHYMVKSRVRDIMPQGAPDWFRYVQFAVFFAIIYLILRTLERRQIHVRL